MRILVNSLPKSGTHLLGELMKQMGFQSSRLHISASMNRRTERNPLRRAIKRARVTRDSEKGVSVDIDDLSELISTDWFRTQLRKVPDGHHCLGHAPFSHKLVDMLSEEGFRVCFMIRDPRDVIVSYCNYVLRLKKHPAHEYFSSFTNNEQRFMKVVHGFHVSDTNYLPPLRTELENCKGWLTCNKVCTIRFEELIGPRGGGTTEAQRACIQRVLDYLGSYNFPSAETLASQVFSTKAQTFHKGQIGAWRNAFSDRVRHEVDQTCGDLMKEFGYSD